MRVSISLPDWVGAYPVGPFDGLNSRMRWVVGLARENVVRGTGGPFAAGVFDGRGELVAPGVNVVAASGCSIAHAEVMAITLAQRAAGRYDLAGDGGPYELVTSVEPCAMCFGALVWSGISRLVCGARDADARAIGFDEGPKLPDWPDALASRGITVTRDVLRDEAAAVLRDYRDGGGVIYNPNRGEPGQ